MRCRSRSRGLLISGYDDHFLIIDRAGTDCVFGVRSPNGGTAEYVFEKRRYSRDRQVPGPEAGSAPPVELSIRCGEQLGQAAPGDLRMLDAGGFDPVAP